MKRDLFHIPEGIIYLDGNSLGPMPKATAARVAQTVTDEWGDMLITAWNKAGWMVQPSKLGDRIGRLIGAPNNSVVLGDTLSIKVFQALASAVAMNPDRKIILSDNGNFPTDLYMAEGLIRTLDRGFELCTPNPEDVIDSIDETVAVLLLTQVDYRTGRMHDMAGITAKAHEKGVVVIWDLAHSAGALPVDIAGCNAEFAVGCTYKYLNGGPGAPAFIYARPDLAQTIKPALSGWLGHAEPFAFDLNYRAGAGSERMRVGTPPVLQMAALSASMDIWDQVDMNDIRAQSIDLSELFIKLVKQSCPDLEMASPTDPQIRGSQVSVRFKEGYAAMQALISKGVIGDFRAPNIMRFGFCPLYNTQTDIETAVAILADIMQNRLWDTPEFKTRVAVT